MKLISLKLVNYRRFQGEHKIEFASDPKKNVTLIRAENGAGKTGILMALLFGLFGVVKYDQFQIENDDDIMVSRPLLTLGSTVKAKVEIEFIDNDSNYKVIREVTANNINGTISQNSDDIKVWFYKDGINQNRTRDEIDKFMNNMIAENIRGFLFFDGVRYMDLFKNSKHESKKELKKIIEKMLNINDLDETIKALDLLMKQVSNETNDRKLASKLRNTLNDIEKHSQEIDDLNLQLEEKEKFNIETQNTYDDQKRKANEIEEYRSVLEEIKSNEDLIKQSEFELQKEMGDLKLDAKSILKSRIHSTKGKINYNIFREYSMKSDDNTNVIRWVLNSNKCICGDDLSTDKRGYLEKQLDVATKSDYIPSIGNNFNYIIDEIERSSKDNKNQFNDYYDLIDKLISKIDSLKKENFILHEQIPFEGLKVQELIDNNNENLGMLMERINSNKIDIDKWKLETELLRDKIDKLEVVKDQVQGDIAELNNEKYKYDLYSSTKTNLLKLKEEYLIEAQQNISQKANEFFKRLLSEDDKESISELKINSEYQIQAFNNYKQEIFADLSAGQKLLASMAFTMGLTAVASSAKPTTNFPLVMDTPMSNLDKSNRSRLIQTMPEAVIQWILTPMDTELTDFEINEFDKTERVGKVYLLKKNNELSEIKLIDNLSELKEVIR